MDMGGTFNRTANLIDSLELDYVVGSVHFLGEYAVDQDDYGIWRKQGGLRKQLKDLHVDLLQAVRRIEKDEVGSDVLCFQVAQGSDDFLFHHLKARVDSQAG